MSTVKAVRIEAFGGPEELKLVDLEVGEPGPGQVRIRHEAIGLNFIDIYQRTGVYPLKLPVTLGMEGAGVVGRRGRRSRPATGRPTPRCRRGPMPRRG